MNTAFLAIVDANQKAALLGIPLLALLIADLTVTASLWWMSGLWAQGSYGLDVLKYTETLSAVTRTSLPNEIRSELSASSGSSGVASRYASGLPV